MQRELRITVRILVRKLNHSVPLVYYEEKQDCGKFRVLILILFQYCPVILMHNLMIKLYFLEVRDAHKGNIKNL